MVPSDVTTGALEPNPKASADWPTRLSVGAPEPFTPYWYASITPVEPLELTEPEAVGM